MNKPTQPHPEAPRVSETPSDLECLLTAVIYETDIVSRERYMGIAKSFLGRQDARAGAFRDPKGCKVRARQIERELLVYGL